jgi:hypothetical protein
MSTNGQQSNAADGRGEAWFADIDGAKKHLQSLGKVLRFTIYADRMEALGLVPPDYSVRTLSDIADAQQWVAWRVKLDDKGKPQKKPKNPATGGNAQVPTNPKTYGSRAAAENCWQTIKKNSASAEGGVGVVLGKLDNGQYLVGLDLDSSYNAGEITDSAQEGDRPLQYLCGDQSVGQGCQALLPDDGR